MAGEATVLSAEVGARQRLGIEVPEKIKAQLIEQSEKQKTAAVSPVPETCRVT